MKMNKIVKVGALAVSLTALSATGALADEVCALYVDGTATVTGGATSTGVGSLACGTNADTDGTPIGGYINATAVGEDSAALGDDSTAIGYNAIAGTDLDGVDPDQATAVGASASAQALNATAIGQGATADFDNATAVGQGATATDDDASAFGQNSAASGIGATALGVDTISSGLASTAVGAGAWALDDGATALGVASLASGEDSTAVGAGATADTLNSVAIGAGASAGNAVPLVDEVNATAVGAGATAAFTGSSAIGAGATAQYAGQMAFGTAANTYRMEGITSGASRAAQSGPLEIVTTDAAGHMASDGGVVFDKLSEHGGGIAIAMAMANPDLTGNEKFGLAGNVGFYEGNTALAFTAMGVVGRNMMGYGDRWALAGGVGFTVNEDDLGDRSGGSSVGGRAGLQVSW